jgi:hypothetical protein
MRKLTNESYVLFDPDICCYVGGSKSLRCRFREYAAYERGVVRRDRTTLRSEDATDRRGGGLEMGRGQLESLKVWFTSRQQRVLQPPALAFQEAVSRPLLTPTRGYATRVA